MALSARERLLAQLDLAVQRDRDLNGRWIYVTFDPDSDDPINASGVYSSEADAFLAAENETRDERSHGENRSLRKVLPLFVDREPEW